MKTTNILFLIFLLIGLTNCGKNEIIPNGSDIKFCSVGNSSEIIVSYHEIIGYDTTKHIFQIKESAWNRINDGISRDMLPGYGFSVNIEDQIIYTANYIPPTVSSIKSDIITFLLPEPGLVQITLGYPAYLDVFTGEDLRNNTQLIAQLEADHKIINIED